MPESMDFNAGVRNKKIMRVFDAEYDFVYLTIDKDSGLLTGIGVITDFGGDNLFSYGVPYGSVNFLDNSLNF